MRYTGIVEDHRVTVSGFLGAKLGVNARLYFGNAASPDGVTSVEIPASRVKLSLGDDLGGWLMLALESRGASERDGDLIKSDDLIWTKESGEEFEMLFAVPKAGENGPDWETVVIAMPKGSARLVLGRLYDRLCERGEVMRLRLLKQANDLMAA